LLLEAPDRPACYVEVKNVSFIRQPGLAEFPDCRTERGMKHLHEMASMVRLGCRAVMVYLVQCETPTRFTLATDLDPDYAKAYLMARDSGVEAIALKCKMSTSGIEIDGEIPISEP
jgi:sugar fermentation stimulation protein A